VSDDTEEKIGRQGSLALHDGLQPVSKNERAKKERLERETKYKRFRRDTMDKGVNKSSEGGGHMVGGATRVDKATEMN